MNRTALSLLLCGGLVIAASGVARDVSAEAAPKIAVVSVSKVFDGYVKSKAANEELQKKRKGYQDYLDVLNSTARDLQTTVQALQKELLKEGLDAKRKDEIEDELERKRIQIQVQTNEIRTHVKNANTQVNTFSSTMRRSILAEIRQEIDAVGKEKKIDLIFDASGLTSTNVPALVYQSGQNDLTEEVVKRLNTKVDAPAKKDAPK